jgi:hypothetical protein
MLDEGRRLEVLAAIGVDVYRLRSASAKSATTAAPATMHVHAEARSEAGLVVVCAHRTRDDVRLSRLFAQLPHALGVAASRLTWIEISADGTLASLPAAPAYLLVGSAAAQAGAAHLSLPQQNQAAIAVSADPQELLADAQSRRVFWQVLKPLARRLRADGG